MFSGTNKMIQKSQLMKPKISIIVPVYNVEKYLDRCVQSLIHQTLKDIEIILVDDQSPDNCPLMCDDYAKNDPRIRVIHKKNGGLGMARNSGIEVAQGEYISFIDSDDFVDTKTYETLYNKALEKELDTCFFRSCRYLDNGKIEHVKDSTKEAYFLNEKDRKQFLLEMVGPEPSYPLPEKYSMSACKAIYSLRLIIENNIRFVSERVVASEDLIFHLDYIPTTQRIGYLPYTFYYYFVNTNSITTTYSEEKYARLIRLLQITENKLTQLYSYEEHKTHYYAQIIRIYKVILRFESLKKDSLSDKIKNIAHKLDTVILRRMFANISKNEYSKFNQLYLFCLKHKFAPFFILFYYTRKYTKI